MPEADFQALREFYILEPFDDEHRLHRPAALIAASMGGEFEKNLAFLRPPPPSPVPDSARFSESDMRSMAAFGVPIPKR